MLTSKCSFILIPPTGGSSRQIILIDGVLSFADSGVLSQGNFASVSLNI